jgi:hypothetical protein
MCHQEGTQTPAQDWEAEEGAKAGKKAGSISGTGFDLSQISLIEK